MSRHHDTETLSLLAEIERHTEAAPDPGPAFDADAAREVYNAWYAPPEDDLLVLARDAVVFYPGTDWTRCHVQLKAMEAAAKALGLAAPWGKMSAALAKAQLELKRPQRAPWPDA